MTTGATFVDFGEKRLLGNTDFDDRFLSYLRTLVKENVERSFNTGVVYDVALALSAGGNDKFDIDGTSEATDGDGHILDIDGSGFASGVQFENTAAIDYEVALHYAEVPDGIQINPRKGVPEYIGTKEFIGESANPSTVVDNTTTLTFGVDSVAEAGVSHAGRTCRVFKKIPGENATTPSIAIEDVVVNWTGTVNKITTTGVLGQESPNSTNPADYTVVMLGPTVRRNTTLLGVDGYAFIGIVTGTGAGNPPVTFDTTGQNLVVASLSNLSDITSRKTNDRLRVDVKSFAADVSEAQLLVRNPSGTPVFQVDGNGNLTVAGTTTQQDVVQVNSSETITDNLTAGDNDAVDSHLIKGTWRHTDTAGAATYFRVNGASGNIDIGGDVLPLADNTHDLGSSSLRWANFFVNNLSAAGDFLPIVDDTQDLGSPALRWAELHVNNIFPSGDFLPIVDDTQDLGSAALQWRNLWLDGTANIDTLSLSVVAGEGISSGFFPTITNNFSLGSTTYRWRDLWLDGSAYMDRFVLSDAATEGCGGNFVPIANTTYDLGNSSYKWNNLYIDGTAFADTLWVSDTAFEGVANHFVPVADSTYNLGNASYQWKRLYLSAAAGDGVADDLVPISDGSYSLGTSSYSWGQLYVDGTSFDGNPNVIRRTASLSGTSTCLKIAEINTEASGAASNVVALNAEATISNTSGTVATCNAMYARAARSQAGTVTDLIAHSAITSVGSPGTATNSYSYYAWGATGAGTITNNYGLYVVGLTAGSTNYAIYTNAGLVRIGDQMTVGSPTGGFKGAGTINAVGVYDDDVLLTDFVFESGYRYAGIDEMGAFCKTEKHLPTIPGREEWEEKGSFSLGKLGTRLWETIEVHALYILELHERIKRLEAGQVS